MYVILVKQQIYSFTARKTNVFLGLSVHVTLRQRHDHTMWRSWLLLLVC